jgi:Protein of unknown function (DUF1153)
MNFAARQRSRKERARRNALMPVSRWTPARREHVLRCIDRGIVTATEVLRVHGVPAEELGEWRRRDYARKAS